MEGKGSWIYHYLISAVRCIGVSHEHLLYFGYSASFLPSCLEEPPVCRSLKGAELSLSIQRLRYTRHSWSLPPLGHVAWVLAEGHDRAAAVSSPSESGVQLRTASVLSRHPVAWPWSHVSSAQSPSLLYPSLALQPACCFWGFSLFSHQIPILHKIIIADFSCL